MKVMVTANISMDLDVANGTQGEIVEIVIDEWEKPDNLQGATIKLEYPPCFVLVKLMQTKVA